MKPKIKNKLKVPLITMFLANSGGLSSKRVVGILAWLICLLIFILAFILNKQIPDFGDLILITSTSLLGVDSVSNIFQKRVNV